MVPRPRSLVRRFVWSLVLFVALTLAAGLIWGLSGAEASDPSPSPAGDTVALGLVNPESSRGPSSAN